MSEAQRDAAAVRIPPPAVFGVATVVGIGLQFVLPLRLPLPLASGVYRYTRNPMYVSMTALQVAVGVALANGWLLVLAPVALATVYGVAVRHEEAYLGRKFGDAYASYRSSVRRWL